MVTRRDFLWTLGAGGVLLNLNGCSARSLPLRQSAFQELHERDMPFLGLATSLKKEYDYEATIEGEVPEDLRGTLYRNGPGLFDRGGLRKRSMLDGDGMIQAFRFHNNGVHYQNRFVRTDKYIEEFAEDRFIYPTWSTQAPGGFFTNFWAADKLKGQAGITVVIRNGKLYAFDESSLPYELDPGTLDTAGVSYLGLPAGFTIYAAHSKIDSHTGEWLHFGLEFGPKLKLHITIFDKEGRLKKHRSVKMPRYVYMHDYFVSDKHLIFILHPAEISFWGFLLGQRSISDSLRWKPGKGNIVMVIDRDGDAEPVLLNTDACFMWHSVNAYEEKGEIIADFVGYQNPDHFIGEDPVIFAVMSGRKGQYNFPGQIRRYVIDPVKKTLGHEILDTGRYEWPFINQNYLCHKYRICYLAKCREGEFFWSAITRFDMKNGRSETFDFGEGLYCSEPVFARKPGFLYTQASDNEPGWLMTEVYNSHTKKSFLSVLQADRLIEGPVAKIHLEHHAPFSYHGFWHGRA